MTARVGTAPSPGLQSPGLQPTTVLTFLHLALLMTLGYGYQMVRLFPPYGVPLSELLLLWLVLFSRPSQVFGRLRSVLPLTPFVGWLLYGGAIIVFSIPENGYRALRDGSPVIESLFLYVGFLVAGRRGALAALSRWLPWFFGFAFLYALLYPFRGLLAPLSPVLSGVQGQAVPVLFTFTNVSLTLVVLSAYALSGAQHRHKLTWGGIGVLALAVALVLFPSRTLLLMIAAVVVYFFAYAGRVWLGGMLGLVAVVVLFLPAVLSLGIHSRLGVLDPGSYLVLAFEIFDFRENVETISSGNLIRILWWKSILAEWASSWSTILFGSGYGMPLMHFIARGGVTVYEPHNTLVSVLARTGVIGAALFGWLQGAIVWRAFAVARACKNEPRHAAVAVALLFVLLSTLIASIGETPFVMPIYAVPYYFCAGVMLRLADILRDAGGRILPPAGPVSAPR